MPDTLQPCLIDVTNNNTTPIATSNKDSTLSSQDDSDQLPQLSSPSSASTMSSPFSLVEVTTTANYGKRPYPTVLPLEDAQIVQPHHYIQSTSSTVSSTLCSDDNLIDSAAQKDLKQYRCIYCGSTDSAKWDDMPDRSSTCCHECFTDQCTMITSTSVTICSDTTPPKRQRFDQDIQQQNYLDAVANSSIPTTSETDDLSTVTSLSKPASSQPMTSASIASPILTASIASCSVSANNKSTSPEVSPTSIDALNTSTRPIMPSPSIVSRVCSECNASDPPLWRNGPNGKKTLCNACGIRYSKYLRGSLSDWHHKPSTDGQKKKHNKTRRPEDTTTTVGDPAISSPATSFTKTNLTTGGNALPESRLKKRDTLHERKTYLKAGMHSGGFNRTDSEPFNFSLPLHQGALLLDTEHDFELPFDIREEYESGRLSSWTDYSSTKKPPRFIRILHNSFVERKTRKEEHQAVCHCLPPASGVGCGEDCLNRMMFFECDPSTCPCGDQCSNQSFRKRQFVKGLKVYLTEGRGWGLMTKEFIRKGTLITEYRGEIISDKTCQERIRTVYKHQQNFYFLDYHKGEVIDACNKGSEARFINHGCDPNCHIEKWSRNGEFHLGVFASKDIPIDTELFYDYNFSLFDTEAIGQECRCGSSKCRGFLTQKNR